MTSDFKRLRPFALGESPKLLTPEEAAAAEAHERTERLAAWEAEQDAGTETFLELCGVRREHREPLLARRGPLESNTARAAVARFLADPSMVFCLLLGSVGNGKTLAASEALLSLKVPVESPYFGKSWRWGRPGVFVKAQALASMSAFGEHREEFLRIAATPLLVLDEVGAERVPFRGVFDDLVDDRYAEHRRTVITSNLDPEAFKAAYGDRVVSRIRQYGVVAHCKEPDYRARRSA